MKTPSYIANFDSATAMLRALGQFLHGQDFPGLGFNPNSLEPLARLLNHLPPSLRESIYTWSGWSEAIAPRQLDQVRAEEISQWMVSHYPKRSYPAVAIGSSSGALVHLCAALGIPWLPQTCLIPVARSGVHPDDPRAEMEWGREPGRRLLDANPELQLHHMHDPNQDRLMIQRMTYFRVKRLRLGEAYVRFLTERLEPGGTIFLSECNLQWPTVQVGDRHFFQQGALGGATSEEYFEGSPQVEEFLTRHNSPVRQWDSPPPDGEQPEAEWGFAEPLRDDIERIAQRRGYRIRRLTFENPMHLSPLVADLYRWWYRRRRLISNRLLGESFILLEPWWTFRTASVPFWTVFSVEPAAQLLKEYLDQSEAFDEIYMMLFSHGVDSIRLATLPEWRTILERARKHGQFLGVDERVFPRDFATFIRYYTDLKRTIPARYPIPGPLSLDQFDEFLSGWDNPSSSSPQLAEAIRG